MIVLDDELSLLVELELVNNCRVELLEFVDSLLLLEVNIKVDCVVELDVRLCSVDNELRDVELEVSLCAVLELDEELEVELVSCSVLDELDDIDDDELLEADDTEVSDASVELEDDCEL